MCRRIILAVAGLVLVSACASSSSVATRSPLDILADSDDFTVQQTSENVIPSILAYTDDIFETPQETVQGLPTVEYRYNCPGTLQPPKRVLPSDVWSR